MGLFGLTIVVGCDRKQMLFVKTRMDTMEREMTTHTYLIMVKGGSQPECSSKKLSGLMTTALSEDKSMMATARSLELIETIERKR